MIARVFFFLITFALPSLCGASDWSECRERIAPVVKELRSKSKALMKAATIDGKGPQVDVGTCASRLRKLDGNFLCCKTFTNIAPMWEEISCLDLKKFYLEKSCDCISKGGFSSDEVLQDNVFEQLAAIKNLRKKALEKGIPNKLIRKYVAGMSEAVDCMNNQSLLILNNIDTQLSDAVK